MKISFIVGTRPELIKVAPVIKVAKDIPDIVVEVVSSGQHTDLLEGLWSLFDISPDVNLVIERRSGSLSELTAKSISVIDQYIYSSELKPNVLVAQGDTTTVMASSVVSFYHRIGFAHIEAGLRSFDLQNPFPEELNRRIAAIGATYHFCPTIQSQNNLLSEGVAEGRTHVVGNTVVDSVGWIKGNYELSVEELMQNERFSGLSNRELVLVTCHRRENQGLALLSIIRAIDSLAKEFGNMDFIWPVHPNPRVRDVVLQSSLSNLSNVHLIEPLGYHDLLCVLNNAKVVLTDSGGLQEEAPSFNVPCLVFRKTTERPESVIYGYSRLVGSNFEKIVREFKDCVNEPSISMNNPYGDGYASERIVNILLNRISRPYIQ